MYPEEIVQRALKLSQEGWTDREVARRCDVSIAAVRTWRYGTRRRRMDPADPSSGDARAKGDCPRCLDRKLDERSYAYLLGIYLG